MSAVQLKINIVKLGSVKMIKFQGDMTVQEVCRDIKEKLGEEGGGSDHGLFWPDQGKWLEPRRTLDFYDLKSGDLLEYKKKHRPLRVKMMDDTVKTILIDDSLNVADLVKVVCQRIGITNPDEFSFTTEKLEEAARQPAKVDPKTKAPTQKTGETTWLNPEKSLREQGVDENEMILLKKKFFFSDQNIDRNDPIQLNLLYVQAQEAIVKGVHPCTLEEACQFAALQLQVQFGNHEPDKHKQGFINLATILPPDYVKLKGDAEKKIFQEHRKLQGMTELNAKFRYVQLCRSLKTYGVTFFSVREKVAKKNKMVNILLGVTRDSVMRLDAETKEVLKVWPLTTLRRWAASPKSFTLDFGDYSDNYYSVETLEGDAISQLIAGYIDIIVKKKKDADRLMAEEDQEMSIVEDVVEGYNATSISMIPGRAGQLNMVDVAQAGVAYGADGQPIGSVQQGKSSMQYVNMSSAMGTAQGGHGGMSLQSPAHQALLQSINNGFASVNAAQSDLNVATTLPPLGNDPASIQWRKQNLDVNKQQVQSQVASHLAATASVINLTAVDLKDMDFNLISTQIATISGNLGQLASGTKMIAALLEDQSDSEKLLEAARKLAAATQKLLTSAQATITGQGNRQDLLASAQGIGASGAQLLRHMGDADVSLAAQQDLIELAKQVAVAMTEAVQHAKTVAGATPDPKNQQEVITATKTSAASAAQLVTTTNVVAPTINSPLCQEQLVESANQVDAAISAVVSKGKVSCTDNAAVANLSAAADKVRAALQKLIDKARQGGTEDADLNQIDRHSEIVFAATQALIDSLGNATAIVGSAKSLALASTQLVNALKAQAATEGDENEKARLLAAARALADATTKMVNAAKDAARNPSDPQVQARLKAAAEALAAATRAAAGADNRRKAFKKLALAAKANAASATQLIQAAKNVSSSNRNQASQMQLINASKSMAEQTGQLVTAVRSFNESPDDAVAQLKLINAAKALLVPGQGMVAAAKAASPTIGDQSAQNQLINFTKSSNDALKKLKDTIDAAEAVSGSLELESAIETVSNTRADLQRAKVQAKKGELRPAADQTADNCMLEVTANAKSIGSSMAQLIQAASQGNEGYTGVAARDTAQALQALGNAVRGVAATSSDRELQDQTIDTATEVMDRSDKLIKVAQASLANPSDSENQTKLANVATEVNKAMAQLVDILPGQRDVTKAIANMHKNVVRINEVPAKQPGETFVSAQNKLSTTAAAVTVSSNNLVNAAKGTPQQLKQAAEHLDAAFNNLVNAGQVLSSQSDPKMQAEIANYINETFTSITRLLQASKAFNADPNGSNLKNLLTVAAKGVADSINKLLSLCSAAAPGQKECTQALQTLDLALSKLDNVNEPNLDNEDPYLSAVKKLAEQQAVLTSLFVAIPLAAKAGDPQSIGNGVVKAADAIFALTDTTARAVYLIGVSDGSSVAAVPGLIDIGKVSQAIVEIEEATSKLQDTANKQQQILAAASIIAKNTSALCNYCKNAAAKTSNAVAKNQFVASAKTVAATTQSLVSNIKALATNVNDQNARAACNESSQPLLDAIQNLKTFAASPEFASTAAYVSPMAQKHQQPIIKQARDVISSSKDLVGTVKTICGNSSDADTIQLFNAQTKGINDSIRALVNSIKNGAPGQKECDAAIDKVSSDVVALDGALIKAAAHDLKPEPGPDFSGYRDMLLNNIHAVESTLDIISKSAKNDPESLGQAVNQLVQSFAPLSTNGIGAAARTNDPNAQNKTLELTKAAAEATIEMLYATKAAGTSADAAAAQGKLDQAIGKVASSLKALTGHLEGASDETGEINQVISDLSRAMNSLNDDDEALGADAHYQQFADEVTSIAKDLATTMTDIVGKARDLDELPALASVVGEKYGRLVRSARGAAATSGEEDVKQSVLESVRALGGSNVRLLDTMKNAVSNPQDPTNRGKISTTARDVSQGVAKLVIAVKNGSKGLLMCQQAIESINDVIADLETAVVFAQAGQLDPTDKADNFNNYKETILSGTKDLTNDVKGLVAASTASQDLLAASASSSVNTIVNLKDSVKNAAASITSADRNGQEQLLTATKNVAAKLQQHIEASMRASSRQANDINNLRESAKNMVASISELLRVVKVVGDDASRALRAIDTAKAGVAEAIQTLNSSEGAMGTALPADVIASAKAVAAAAAQLVTSSNTSQDDVIAAAGQARATIEDLVRVGKASTENAPKDLQANVQNSVRNTANAMSHMLDVVKTLQTASTPANKESVKVGAKTVAETVNKVVEAAGKLIPSGYVDPNDPNVIAERELLAAANSIEAAARKLAALQPPERPRDANEDLPFEAQILEAAKAIAAATAALVRSATFAQREIVASGKSGPQEDSMYFNDGTWSDGLVSAAKAVAGTTGDLCDSANDAVQGKADKDRIIVSAKGVSSSTQQLLSAATVKADFNSESVNRLRAAGATVTRATKNLVTAAESSMAFDNTDQVAAEEMKKGVGGKKAEMDQLVEILKKERELEDARKKLAILRSQKYTK